MIRSLARLAPLFLALAAFACGDDDDDSSSGSYNCETAAGAGHTCTSASGGTADQVAAAEKSCTDGGGKVASSCPSDGKIGTCTITGNGGSASVTYYSDSGLDAAAAKSGCESSGGTWAE